MPYEKVGDNEPICIADEVPFEIPEDWEWVRLENIIYLKTGLSYKKENLNKKTDNMIRVLRGGNIINNKVIIKEDDIMISKDFITEECQLLKNSLITPAVTSKEQIGKVALIDKTIYNTTIGGFVLEIIPICNNDIFSKMLYIIFNSKYHIDNLKSTTHKSGQAFYNLSREKMLQLLIPLPPLAEQQRIVTEIERYLPLINEYDKLQTELDILDKEFPEKLKKSILQQAIKGKLVEQDPNDEPASVLLEKIRKEKEKLIKEGKIKRDKNESIIYKRDNSYYEKLNGVEKCIDDEIPFEIPESWEWVYLSNVVIFENGDRGDKYPVETDYVKNGIPFFGAKDMGEKYMDLSSVRFISQKKFNELGGGKLKDGDMICLLRGNVGKTKIFKSNNNYTTGFICAQMMIIRNIDLSLLEYLYIIMTSPYYLKILESKTTGTAVKQLPANALSKILIPIPPLCEQEKIISRINQLFYILNIR